MVADLKALGDEDRAMEVMETVDKATEDMAWSPGWPWSFGRSRLW